MCIRDRNDFEQVCYLFKNNANHAILKTKERLVRKLMEKHEKFKDDEGLWSLAMSRQMSEWREKNNLLDSYDEGKKKGLEEGTQIGTTLGTVNLLACLLYTSLVKKSKSVCRRSRTFAEM